MRIFFPAFLTDRSRTNSLVAGSEQPLGSSLGEGMGPTPPVTSAVTCVGLPAEEPTPRMSNPLR